MTLNLCEIRAALATAALVAGPGLLGGCEKPPHGTDTGDSETSETGETSDTDETGDTTGDTEGEIPAVCTRWVECSAEIDPGMADAMAAKYGVGGTCWQEDDAGQAGCYAFCDAQLRQYGDAFPDEMACRYDDIVGAVEFSIGEAVFNPDDPFADPVYRALEPGDTIQIVRGGQGLLMLPLAIRGKGFEVPEDPNEWDDPRMPHINLWIDIEGFNVGFGGHFARVPDYPIGFVPIDDEGTLEHLYIAVLVPDGIEDPQALTSQPGLIRAELRTYMQPTVARELSFVVAPTIQGE
jgi:hypothetical protein